MKSLDPKGDGKIHPSPPSPALADSAATPRKEAAAILRLLPAAIIALTAALGNDDKLVLAYLIKRSMSGLATEELCRCRRTGNFHRPLLDCGCFDCYRSFWSRWNCSPDRELIHQAIEAFEEHLASSEHTGGVEGVNDGGARRVVDWKVQGKNGKKGRKRRKKIETATFNHNDVAQVEAAIAEIGRVFEEETREDVEKDEEAVELEVDEVFREIEIAQPSLPICEHRRDWPDVKASFCSRLWNLWGP
ncbi:hypothetical protein HPP92_008015 [Vanilla planifolia]|uniref:Uncharacterized protein n=1 Tax=Vanilla planifolia TaxID=51239 RepID=A0A835VA54_VANPL|nr:hypothetical protein HPP92_008015 [Vanilla planifolia]